MPDPLEVRLGSQASGVSDHSGSAGPSRVFRNRRAPFLIADAFIQNHPDQLTDAMRNCPDGFVVAEARNETTVDDLEDASFMLSCSMGSLIGGACAGYPSASVGWDSLPRSLPLPGMPPPTRRVS